MATTPRALIEIASRHQVFLERLKSSEVRRLDEFLRAMDRDIVRLLGGRDLTAFSRARLETQLSRVREAMEGHWEGWWQATRASGAELAAYEAGFEVRSLQQVAPNYDFTVPTSRQVLAAALTRPLSVRGPAGGLLLEPFFRDWGDNLIRRVESTVRLAYAEGQTTQQLLRTLRGTAATGYRDGLLGTQAKGAQMLARTAIQHIAVQAREATWAANSDIVRRVKWVSTLDARTTLECQSLDGQEFPLDEGPRPPLHIGCRSTVVPVLDERFKLLGMDGTRAAKGGSTGADETYYEWLARQPEAFQNEALGRDRAQLFRDGGLSAEEFRRLQLGSNFQPLTLDEMRRLEPLAFERAGL